MQMLKRLDTDLQTLNNFLTIKTPKPWLEYAADHIPLLLLDHAHCERKAAATALNFMSKYPERKELVHLMPALAREELLHFEKVVALMHARGLDFGPLLPSEYASNLHKKVTKKDGAQKLCDQLIVGAIIEARSCERFHALIPYIEDKELAKFYAGLLRAEARHFQDYLALARLYGGDIDERLSLFLAFEGELILGKDLVFRFHSGVFSEP
jgi:tRNA-(ms[2]io[6]A)-hydroxylase